VSASERRSGAVSGRRPEWRGRRAAGEGPIGADTARLTLYLSAREESIVSGGVEDARGEVGRGKGGRPETH